MLSPSTVLSSTIGGVGGVFRHAFIIYVTNMPGTHTTHTYTDGESVSAYGEGGVGYNRGQIEWTDMYLILIVGLRPGGRKVPCTTHW